MSNRDNESLDDDLLDEEFDVEGFEEDDSLGDEQWDENDTAQQKKAPPPKKIKPATGERTFLQKNFNLIVIGIVGIGAALFFLSSGPSAPPAAVEEAVETATAIDPEVPAENDLANLQDAAPAPLSEESGLPPMPAPMSSDTAEPAQEQPLATATETLTPLPNESQSIQTSDLASLDVAPVPVEAPAPAEELAVTDTAAPELSTPQEPAAEALSIELSPEAPQENAPAIVETPATSDTPPSAEITRPAETPVIVPDPDVAALEQRIEDLTAELAAKNEDADKQIRGLNSTIEALETKLADMTKSIEALKAKPPQSDKPKKPVLSNKTPAKPRAAAPAPTWELRSASPGQAVLSAKSNGDMKDISVGDTVPGLGRILSIQKQGTLWVVQGTKGSVSR